jgi:hypothetical protein
MKFVWNLISFFKIHLGTFIGCARKPPHIRLFNMRALETLHFTLIRFYFGVVVRSVSSFYNFLFYLFFRFLFHKVIRVSLFYSHIAFIDSSDLRCNSRREIL